MEQQKTKQYRCEQTGHIYTGPANHDPGCPICSATNTPPVNVNSVNVNNEIGETIAIYDSLTEQVSKSDLPDHRHDETVSIYDHLHSKVEPVVGWLASIAGPQIGKDWRLIAGKNSIGRSEQMSVSIDDDSVSREKHAFISFDPKKSTFTLMMGDSSGLVYCNDDEVTLPVKLKAYDRIEVGKTIMIFVPLLGEHFQWS